MPEKDKLDVRKPDPKVVIAKEANPWLIALGCVLIATFVFFVIFNRTVGSETRETPAPAAADSSSSSDAQQASAKTTKTKDVPSDTLLTAILAVGAVLILTGVLYARINSIKLPGGAEIGLTEKEVKATAEKVAEAMPDATPKEVADATVAATTKLQAKKAEAQGEAPLATIHEVVEQSTP